MDLICILDEPRYSNSWHKCNEVPEEVVFVASPDIDLGHPGPYRVAELLDKPFFLTERNANYRRTFDRFLASRQIELTPALRSAIPPLSSRCWSAPPAFPCCRASLWPSLRPEEICAFWRCQTSG